jgi:hypothetical protein
MDYIREAERVEIKRASTPQAGETAESSEQISAVLDTIARDYFARALRKMARKSA